MASLSESLGSGTSFHVLVIGASDVGKNTLISKMKKNWSDVGSIINSNGETVDSLKLGRKDLSAEVFNMSDVNRFSLFDQLPPCDVFLLVYSLVDNDSFHAVAAARDLILKEKGPTAPIVFVANKSDIADSVDQTERVYRDLNISCEWEHGHVEASAKKDADMLPVLEQIIKRYNRNMAYNKEHTESSAKQMFQAFKKFVFGKKDNK